VDRPVDQDIPRESVFHASGTDGVRRRAKDLDTRAASRSPRAAHLCKHLTATHVQHERSARARLAVRDASAGAGRGRPTPPSSSAGPSSTWCSRSTGAAAWAGRAGRRAPEPGGPVEGLCGRGRGCAWIDLRMRQARGDARAGGRHASLPTFHSDVGGFSTSFLSPMGAGHRMEAGRGGHRLAMAAPEPPDPTGATLPADATFEQHPAPGRPCRTQLPSSPGRDPALLAALRNATVSHLWSVRASTIQSSVQ
jgi:hypothetical protein